MNSFISSADSSPASPDNSDNLNTLDGITDPSKFTAVPDQITATSPTVNLPDEPDTPVHHIPQTYTQIKQQVKLLAEKYNRIADDIDILLAVKYQAPASIAAAVKTGGKLLGHNLAQQMVSTGPFLQHLAQQGFPSEMHMIGHLQTNKINSVLRWATCVQTVDSQKLALAIDAAVERMIVREGGIGYLRQAKKLEVFIQVNTSGESSKSGCKPEEALGLAKIVGTLPHIKIRGFMTIGALHPNPKVVDSSLRNLRELRDELLNRQLPGTSEAYELSMGMSADLEPAIANGSTIVRVGSAVFGPRGSKTYLSRYR